MAEKAKIKFRIRNGKKEDIPVILSLVRELARYEKLLNEVVATEEDYYRFGGGPTPYFQTLIGEVYQDGKWQAAGFALYFFTFSTFLGKPTLYLEDLFVLPQYRGNGMGKMFLGYLAKIALEHDCGRMEWAVLDWNTPAIEFYKKLGARPLEEWTTFRLLVPEMKNLSEWVTVTSQGDE